MTPLPVFDPIFLYFACSLTMRVRVRLSTGQQAMHPVSKKRESTSEIKESSDVLDKAQGATQHTFCVVAVYSTSGLEATCFFMQACVSVAQEPCSLSLPSGNAFASTNLQPYSQLGSLFMYNNQQASIWTSMGCQT